MRACVACVCMHVQCAGACLHVTACMCVPWVRVHMCAYAGVFARVRAHACVFMRGCVCACVVGPTYARVHACLLARARMRRVHVRVLARVRAHESVSALMRDVLVYVCGRTRICVCIKCTST